MMNVGFLSKILIRSNVLSIHLGGQLFLLKVGNFG